MPKPFYPVESALHSERVTWGAEELSGCTTAELAEFVAADLIRVVPGGGLYRDELTGLANLKANGVYAAWRAENGLT